MSFPCARCGACCRLAGRVPELAHLDRGDLVCVNLTEDNECSIYDERPAICRVDVSCPPVMAAAEWEQRNVEACGRVHLAVYGSPLVR